MILYDAILLIAYLLLSIRKRHHFGRLSAPVPDSQGKEVIWIHAVSVGEAKSVKTLFGSLRSANPNAFFLVTTTTATGQAEAKRCLDADAFAFLAVDLSWIVRRWARKLRPKLFIMVESDFWPNLLTAIKINGGKTILVSGKLSAVSAKRFAFFRFFSKKLFSLIDLLCVQNEEHAERFRSIADPSRIRIGGNLKLDYRSVPVDAPFWRQKLSIPEPCITLSCTHAPEEDELLDLLPLDRVFIFLAPRHPERFAEVARILDKKKIPYFRFSDLEGKRGEERVMLVDAMGQLPICYALSRLAIVAGSFQSRIGGHNLLEPCLYGVPVLFGPHVFAQTELSDRVLSAGAGKQVSEGDLRGAVESFFNDPNQEKAMRTAACGLIESSGGAAAETLGILRAFLQKV